MNAIIFDSSSIISISEKCFIEILEKLARNSKAEFLIPKAVYFEIVEHPMQIKRFELNAIRIKKAVDDGWLKLVQRDSETENLMRKAIETANNIFFVNEKPITLIQEGEAETLALAKKLCAKAVAIDERTARMLIEDSYRLKQRLENGIGKTIRADNTKLNEFRKMFSGIEIFRSSELIALAWKKGFFVDELAQNKQALEAALYAVKYSGCAVSEKEIEEYLKKQGN